MPSSNGPLEGSRDKLSNDPRDRGTSPPARSVAEFDAGQRVHLSIDPSIPDGRFDHRFNGHTGEVLGKQGTAYKVQINDHGKEKILLVGPAHLNEQQD